jgi:hypothetical protein
LALVENEPPKIVSFLAALRISRGTVIEFSGGHDLGTGVARFLLVQYTNTEKIYQITTKYTKCPKSISNGYKIDQMSVKYDNIFHCKSLQNSPKLLFLV